MKLDILAVGAHPDDVELFAGGTLAKLAALGYSTGIVDLSRGELSTRGTPARRAREAAQAARHLGLKVRENLRLPDGNIQVTSEARLRLVRILRKYSPAVLLAHHWDDRHPDHANASRLVTEAAHHAGLARIKTGQRRHRPARVLYFKLPSRQLPTFVVDIAGYEDRRRAAINAYRSQLFDPNRKGEETYLSRPEFPRHVDNIHAYYGTLIGKAYAEGFYVKEMLEIADPLAFFRDQSSSGIV